MWLPGFSRKEVVAFCVIATVVWVYVAARAVLVPIVHDESATFFFYILTGEFIPGASHWDANNHILNSALSIASSRLFGEGLLALRLPNVLAYALWALAAGWLAGTVKDKMVKWCMVLALLLCPFVLEFFSMCRGYGLGMSFFLLALAAAIRVADKPGRGVIVIMLLSAAIAIWADMALIPALAILLVGSLLMVLILKEQKVLLAWPVLVTLALCAFAWAAAIQHALRLSLHGLLYHGSLAGFVQVTLKPLFRGFVGTDNLWAIFSTIGIGSLVAAWAIRLGSSKYRRLLALVGGSLLLLWVSAEVMAHVKEINYPEDRAALQFFVLFIVVFGLATEVLTRRYTQAHWIAVALLFLPLRSVVTANVAYTTIWPEQSLPGAMVDMAEQEQRAVDHPLFIGLYHQHFLVWSYAQRRRGNTLPRPGHDGFPDPTPDLLLTDARYTDSVPSSYKLILNGGHDGLQLWRREPSMERDPFFRNDIAPVTTRNEFIDLPLPAMQEMPGGPFLIRFHATMILEPAININWVLSGHRGRRASAILNLSHSIPAKKITNRTSMMW